MSAAEFDRSLVEVPKTTEGGFSLSAAQNEAVGDLVVTYLARNSLDFNQLL